MSVRPSFEDRLAEAFARYAAGAPVIVETDAVTHAVAATGLDAWRSAPSMRSLRAVLVVAALLGLLLAGLLVLGAVRHDPVPSPLTRLFVSDGRDAWVLDPEDRVVLSGSLGRRDSHCPTLVGGTSFLAGQGSGTWGLSDLAHQAPLPKLPRDLGDVGFEHWSPDRTKVALLDTGAGVVSVLEFDVLRKGDAAIEDTTVAEASGVVAAAWSADGRRLAIASDPGDGSSLRVRTVGVGTSGESGWTPVSLDLGTARSDRGVTLAWAPDGHRLAVGARAADAREDVVHVLDLERSAEGVASVPLRGVRLTGDAAWAPDSGLLALVAGGEIALADRSGAVRRLLPIPLEGDVQDAAWWPDGSRLLLRGHRTLVSLAPDGSRVTTRSVGSPVQAVFHRGELYTARAGRGVIVERFGRDDPTGIRVVIPRTESSQESMPDLVCLDAQAHVHPSTRARVSDSTRRSPSKEETPMPLPLRTARPLATVLAAATALATPASVAAASASLEPLPGLADGEPWLAYQWASGERGGAHGVHLIRPDGTGAVFAGGSIPGGEQLHPDWSPDGRRIVLDVSDVDETYDLWILDTATWEAERIVDCTAPCLWVQEPAWSPDGERIALQRHTATDAGEVSTVEILDLGSGDLTTVYETDPSLGVFAPRWSPDGRSLVFEQLVLDGDSFAGLSLEVLDLAKPGVTRTIVPAEVFANNSDWSPDGSLIAFSAPAEGGEPGGRLSDIWVVAPDGTGQRRVTDLASTGGTAVQPTFMPDGLRIVFKGSGGAMGDDVMASIAVDGSDLAPVVGDEYLRGWHPRLRPTP